MQTYQTFDGADDGRRVPIDTTARVVSYDLEGTGRVEEAWRDVRLSQRPEYAPVMDEIEFYTLFSIAHDMLR